jgi:hypothetical protein
MAERRSKDEAAQVKQPRRRRLQRRIEYTCLAADTGTMATPPRKRRLSPQPRRAIELLELLASSPHGATEALHVRAHGFSGDMIASLVGAGLATTERETMKAGAEPIEVVRVRITDAGRSAIEG